ncbi:MAG: hypothetical protein M3R36_08175 [Bacteroidota bacterium]|nr:hypothetical protein [Bacteroidota bacterium]
MNDQKKEAKKNRPLVINCRKFIRIEGKNFNSPPVRKNTDGWLRQEIFAFRQYSEFLSAIFHRRESKINKNSN